MSLLRSNLVVASGTALSRLSGLARITVFGYVIGQTALADAYRIGNETPNIVYELLLGGVLSATLVPLFTSFDHREDEESTNVVITVSLVLLGGITLVALVAAPLIFSLYTLNPGGGVDPELFHDVGTLLTRLFLLQIFFYGATALATAILNSRRRFFAAAWSPIVPNLIIIASLLSLPGAGSTGWTLDDVVDDSRVRWTLGLGATAGIAAMALVLIPAVRRSGLHFRPRLEFRHPAVRRLLTLSGWTLGYVVANQVVIVVVRNLADPGSGDATAYFDAYTFFVLPHGLLAMSIATTFAPEMARAVARHDRDAFTARASLGVRLIGLLTVPAGILLFVLRGFYAHQDTRTPFVINLFECALNIVLAFALVGRYGILGLGLAFAISYVVSALWSLQVLSYKVPTFAFGSVFRRLLPMIVAGVFAGEVMWLVAVNVGGNSGGEAVLRLAVAGLVGIAAYVAALFVLRVPEVTGIVDRIRAVRPSPSET